MIKDLLLKYRLINVKKKGPVKVSIMMSLLADKSQVFQISVASFVVLFRISHLMYVSVVIRLEYDSN